MKKIYSLLFAFSIFTMLVAQAPLESSWRYYRPGNTGIQEDQATALWIDESGDPYIAASTCNWGEGGFARFSQLENRWINYSNVDYPVLGSFDNGEVQILDIVKDSEDNLWMGNFTGALKFDPEAGPLSTEKYDAGNFWALRMSVDGNWETLEYQRPDGTWRPGDFNLSIDDEGNV
jgi:hypothetical protein